MRGAMEITFKAPTNVLRIVEAQATDPDSRLAAGPMHSFLVEKSAPHDDEDGEEESDKGEAAHQEKDEDEKAPQTPVKESGIDIDTAMPYGDLEPFGREDT